MKLAAKNTIISLLLEIVKVFSGLILPRFFTETYGSEINGLIASISQFVVYMGLVEAGVSSAGIAQLYKPLVEKNYSEINAIVSGARSFYLRSGLIFVILIPLLMIVYPMIVSSQVADDSFVVMMIAVLSVNGIVDYFYLGKYRMLLIADYKNYILVLCQILGTIVTFVVSIALISINASSIVVKSIAAIVHIVNSVVIVFYIRKQYSYLDLRVAPKKSAFSQKRSALLHQIVGMICNSTDVVVLTIMLRTNALVEVSVYGVYNFVAAALVNILSIFSGGVRVAFGQLIAQNKMDILQKRYNVFEYYYFVILGIVYTCMGILLTGFIRLYSDAFSDAQLYNRTYLVVLFTLIGFIQNARIPGSTIHVAAGHFKETEKAAILEAVINIIVSLLFVQPFGIAGVLFGTLASYCYRTTYIIWYTDRKFFTHSAVRTVKRLIRVMWTGMVCIILFSYSDFEINGWLGWFVYAIAVAVIVAIVQILVSATMESSVFKEMIHVIGKMVRREKSL